MDTSTLPPILAQVYHNDLRAEVEAVATELSEFQTMVVVGIGGSSLGLRALLSALGPRKKTVIVCDDLDPVVMQSMMTQIDWDKTAINIVSKSGGTLEIMAIASVLVEALQKSVGKEWTRHVVVTTDPSSGFLRQWATQHQLRSCQIPPDVGGRFSVFTAVGLLPLCWAGYDIIELLAGAQRAVSESAAQKIADQHVTWDRSGRCMAVIMPYTSHLTDYARWFVQLWAESLGKNGVGQTPILAVGTADQHAQLQMFAEGPPNKCIRFITVKSWSHDITVPEPLDSKAQYLHGKSFGQLLETAAEATAKALNHIGCPSYTVTLPALTESALGHLMMTDLMTTLAAAKLYGVDPYGQPGVELGKKLWRERLC